MIAKCQRKIFVSWGDKIFLQNDENAAIFAALYHLRKNAIGRRHLGWVFNFRFPVAQSDARTAEKDGETKQTIDSNMRLATRPRSLKRFSWLGVAMATTRWPPSCCALYEPCALPMFSRFLGRLRCLLVSSVAVLNSDITVIKVVMLRIMHQIGKCAARKTRQKRSRDIVVVHPWVESAVRACTIGVREVNFWTHCDVIKRWVIAVFHSELASFGSGMTDSPDVVARAALPWCVRAVADSGIGCYWTRVIIYVLEAKFNGKSEVVKHSKVT